jgi:predicted protein tyrosine phosphatase
VLDLPFDWITEDLAIGGAFPPDRCAELVADHRIGAVIDLREEGRDDEASLKRHGVQFLHLPTPDLLGVSVADLHRGVAFADAAAARRQRVLVHCQHGIGRSAVMALAILVHRGLSPLEALELAKIRRAKVSPSPHQHQAWCAWLRARGMPAPDFERFAAIAYRHLRTDA